HVCILTVLATAFVSSDAWGTVTTSARFWSSTDGTTWTDTGRTTQSLALGESAWTIRIGLYANTTGSSSAHEFYDGSDWWESADYGQYWKTYFQLAGTTGATALADGLLTVGWVNSDISSAFTNFYSSGDDGEFSSVYTGSTSNGTWNGSVNVTNGGGVAGSGSPMDLTIPRNGSGVLFGMIEIKYTPNEDSSFWTALEEAAKQAVDGGYTEDYYTSTESYALTLAENGLDDTTKSEIWATNSSGRERWYASSDSGSRESKITLNLTATISTPESNKPLPEPGTWAMMTGMALVGGMFVRRRARQRT
ncbi:MAG: PEP-CTERM sorting domain-containing protein, partial [Planctomycetia bacterium]|nr:PEP-CTERM sorting domain-containing protein [Planctomycetia bacterium]